MLRQSVKTHIYCSSIPNIALQPTMIGVAQPLGTEVGVRVLRQWCQRHGNDPESVVLKIEFENAFNTVDRQSFLHHCRQHFPELAPWAEWCYLRPSHLWFESVLLSSTSGVQHGDPLGPLYTVFLSPSTVFGPAKVVTWQQWPRVSFCLFG